MRTLHFTFLIWLAAGFCALCADITPDRAAKHVCEVVTVRGTVVRVYLSRAGNAYLDFGAPYPEQTFSANVLFKKTPQLLVDGTDWLVSFRFKEVTVKGKVEMYNGKPEIVIASKADVSAVPAK